MWRTLQKQTGEQNQGKSTAFQGANSLKTILHTTVQGAKIFALCEIPPGTRVPFSHTSSQFSHRAKQGAKFRTVRNLQIILSHLPSFRPCKDQRRPFRLPIHRRLDHSKPHGRRASPPVQAPAIPPSEGEPLLSADTPPGGHPLNLCHLPTKLRDLLLGPLQENQVLGSWRAIPCASAEPPTEEPRIPVGFSRDRYQASHDSRTTDRGQLDCRDRSFHSETYFDIEALRQQPELRDSFRLLQRYHMEDLLTPRQFYYPRVVLDFYQSMTTRGLRNPTLIQFTIDGRQGAIGARHIAEALRIPYEPVIQADFREWSSFSQSDMVRILSRGTSTASVLTRRELPSGMLLIDVLLRANIFPLQHKVQRRGAILEALFRISEGYYFGPHHLIMTSLLHFEEKVHQKKLQRADGIPLLFPRLLCQILEHLGYPEEPRLRGAAIAERTSLSTNGIT
ncbi:hypothetical protein CK203_112238 [Vitis vinifera]|uniref:Uncharacterized protein n=1 Tax=Vitis vinifera TaxID=29760 RepID=A0A438BPB7_VITVI|nr:hypothetical protein CK203_112238 [Vitis vinifera]